MTVQKIKVRREYQSKKLLAWFARFQLLHHLAGY